MTDDKEILREKLEQMWDSIGYDSIADLDKNFKNVATRLLEFLIISLLNEDEVNIGIFSQGVKEGSMVTYDIYYTDDKELTLKLTPNNAFELELSLRDWEDNEKIYKHRLSKNEIKIIPEGLVNLMNETLVELKSRTIKVKSLRK